MVLQISFPPFPLPPPPLTESWRISGAKSCHQRYVVEIFGEFGLEAHEENSAKVCALQNVFRTASRTKVQFLAFELSVQDKPFLVREEYRASDREGEKESSYAPAFSREAEFSSLEFSPP